VFDSDGDGELTWEEFVDFMKNQFLIEEENKPVLPDEEPSEIDPQTMSLKAEGYALDAAASLELQKGSNVTLDQFLRWSEGNEAFSSHLLNALNEICHVRFGLPPTTPHEEAKFIGAYMNRASKKQMKEGDVVYLISMEWWNKWKTAVKYKDSYTILPKAVPAGSEAYGRSGSRQHKRSKSKRGKRSEVAPSSGSPQEMQTVSSNSTTPDPGSTSNSTAEMGTEATVDMEATTVVSGRANPSVTPGICKEDARAAINEINNSPLCADQAAEKKYISLTNEGGKLKERIVRGEDYELIPEEVWKSLSFWYRGKYAQEEPPLPRYVTKAEDGCGLELELYPVHFLMYKHTQYPPQSPKSTVQIIWGTICTAMGIGGDSGKNNSGDLPEGLSQPTPPSRVPYYRAAFSRNATMKEISGILEGLLRVKPDELRLHDYRDENDPKLLDFEQEGKTVSELNFRNGDKLLIETCNRDNTWPEELIKALKEAKRKEIDEEESAKERAKDKNRKEDKELVVRVPPGVTGLSNLGNTCFMNSAVQCVSNTSLLTKYFRSKQYLEHINKDNPLGMRGDIAKRYGDLVGELWKGTSKSIVPLRFRLTIARYSPQFAGFQQQDAQELLAFLLDGLHEDLNRVHKKVYRELKDSDGRPDQEVADEAWDYHLERNQSIVVDLFHGQLKSRLRCLKCGFVSVKFDPFTFLSLPLPMESTVEVDVTFVAMDGEGPIRYLFKVDPEGKYSKLREELSTLSGVPANQLMFADSIGGIIRDVPSLTSKVKSVLSGFLFAFEIPPPSELKPIPRTESLENIERRRRLNTLSQMQKKTTSEGKQTQAEGAGPTSAKESVKDQSSEEVIQPISRSDSLEHIVRRERLNTLSKKKQQEGQSQEGSSEPGGEGGRDGQSDLPPEEIIQPIGRSESLEHIVRRERLNTLSQKMQQEGQSKERSGEPGGEQKEDDAEKKGENNESTSGVQQAEGKHPELSQPVGDSPDSPSSIMDPVNPSIATPTHNQMSNNIFDNYVIAMHRKMMTMDGPYFLAISKVRLSVFGTPVIVACEGKTNKDIYHDVWRQVERLISKDTKFNQKFQVEDEFPFKLKMVDKYGLRCARCSRYNFCSGCVLEYREDVFSNPCSYLAIDWDPTVLHLRYQYTLERPREHESVQKSRTEQSEPIDLLHCLRAFTKEEELGDEDHWYCKQCKSHQRAAKKLEIWRLPPVLIVHVKRFQFYHSRWIKSQRVVNFPTHSFNPISFKVGDLREPKVASDNPTGDSTSTEEETVPQQSIQATSSQQEVAVEIHTRDQTEGEGKITPSTAENPPAENPPAENPPAENPPAENPPAENPPAENPPAENPPAETSSEDKTSIESPSSDHVTFKGDPPVEEKETDENEGISARTDANGCVSTDEKVGSTPPLQRMLSYAKQVSVAEKPSTYNLYAMTTHYGVLGGGHYVAFAKNKTGKWYHYNDSACRETTEERVTKEPPYLLFYEREDFDFDKILDLLGGPVNSPEDSSQVGEGGGNISRCRVM
jgi:ubiquitin carboxyl-terminal hydrolase 6/32